MLFSSIRLIFRYYLFDIDTRLLRTLRLTSTRLSEEFRERKSSLKSISSNEKSSCVRRFRGVRSVNQKHKREEAESMLHGGFDIICF